VGVVILIGFLTLVVGHPHVTRQQAIQAAMKWGGGQPSPRVEAKFMHYRDLLKADPQLGWGTDGVDYYVWVVAVSGKFGISPSGPCCFVPPPTTWGIAVVKDEWGTPKATTFESGNKGNWPPFFDDLPDLARGQN
jgi:hypothetical protein